MVLCVLSACLSCSSHVTSNSQEPDSPVAQGTYEKLQWLRDFGSEYEYNTDYMEALLEMSPEAYASFEAAMEMGESRKYLSLEAHHVAKISALMGDNCGACTQLGLRLAVEAGVSREILHHLMSEPELLPDLLRLIYEHANEVIQGNNANLKRVAQLREALGDKGFAELSINIIGVGIYPALRRSVGAETVCPAPSLDF